MLVTRPIVPCESHLSPHVSRPYVTQEAGMTTTATAVFGSSIKRREDPRLIRGQGNYVADIKLVGMLHMAAGAAGSR